MPATLTQFYEVELSLHNCSLKVVFVSLTSRSYLNVLDSRYILAKAQTSISFYFFRGSYAKVQILSPNLMGSLRRQVVVLVPVEQLDCFDFGRNFFSVQNVITFIRDQ